MANRCVIYTRFSPRRNAGECESCEVQEAICRKYAAAHGLDVAAVYADRAVSGCVDVGGRVLQDAIADLGQGDTILAYRADRFARDMIVALQIERAVEARGAVLAVVDGDVPGHDPAANLMRHMLMAIAEYERQMIGARTSAAMREHMRAGRIMSSHLPYGWMVDPSDPRRMVRDPMRQRIIRQIVAMRDGGSSYVQIAKWCNTHVSAKKATVWTPTDCRRVWLRAQDDPPPPPDKEQ